MPKIRFETTPPGAATFVDSVMIGTTPFTAEIKAGEIEVVFWKAGHVIARYRDVVTKDGVVGTSLEEDDSVTAPPIPPGWTPGSSTAPTATAPPARRSRLPLVLGLAVLGGVGAGTIWWYRRRGKRAPRQLRGQQKRVGNGATKIALGAAETTCSPATGRFAVRTCLTRPKEKGPTVRSVDQVCRLLKNAQSGDRESFFTIALGPGLQVLGVEETAKGTVGSVEVHPREVFKSAMLLNASAVIVAHNHPTGDASPSSEDHDLTKRLVKVGQHVGIPVLDHVVIGDGHCVSISERSPSLFKTDQAP